jgi:hypothetical protein
VGNTTGLGSQGLLRALFETDYLVVFLVCFFGFRHVFLPCFVLTTDIRCCQVWVSETGLVSGLILTHRKINSGKTSNRVSSFLRGKAEVIAMKKENGKNEQ